MSGPAARPEPRIGCSGWTYADWRGPFYPEKLPLKQRLAYYASQFDTAEINASFYGLPRASTVETWARTAPPGFVFAWKVSRYITHNLKLVGAGESVERVFGLMRGLGAAQGPALIQLPPSLARDDERLAAFLDLLPRTPCTVEFRHPSWYAPEVFKQLAAHDIALCLSDHHHAPAPWEVTAGFVYVRGHGPGGRYAGRYGDRALKAWAEQIGRWRDQGLAVFCYFDNDIKSAAPLDALRLRELLGQG